MSKKIGGIGVKKLKLFNKVLHCTWIWRYVSEQNSLWRQLVHQKFGGVVKDFFPKNSSMVVKNSL